MDQQGLYGKATSLTNSLLYKDDWDAFAKILPQERHIVGKSGTLCI